MRTAPSALFSGRNLLGPGCRCESREVGRVIAMGVLPSGDEPASSGRAARSPRRYDDSFRRYAVKRAAEPDARVADVAEDLGVSASTLRRWVKAAGAGEAAGGAG